VRLALALRFTIWAGLLIGLWLVLVGEWSQVELVAAVSVAVVAATAAVAARRVPAVRAHVPRAWLADARSLPVAIVADFGILTWVLVRSLLRRERVHGKFRVKPLPATGEGIVGRGVRAWVTVAATVSPNAYVVHIDADDDRVLLHDLVTWSESESPA
jgi:hypothetical protein